MCRLERRVVEELQELDVGRVTLEMALQPVREGSGVRFAGRHVKMAIFRLDAAADATLHHQR